MVIATLPVLGPAVPLHETFPVTKVAEASGHVLGSKPVYCYMLPSQVHVAVANTIHWDVFNGHGSLVMRVLSVRQMPNITTAVTGVNFDWSLFKTSAVGTGGSALTAGLPDSGSVALDALVTARSKPTGGATTAGVSILDYTISSEETNAATQMVHSMMMGGAMDLVPACLRPPASWLGWVLRPGQGLKCVQVTNSAAGNTGWLICFTVE